ncbi:hypothetical protein BGW80DRAFT_1325168 [Lactifluus volemus]|nr:hypothetical protein BGW80DRAFT_1325168 [Lactifluus volemus]
MATATAPRIDVYAILPPTPSNPQWVHCLSLPLETMHSFRFSEKPMKWIRFAIGVVIGAEGDLSTTPNNLDIIDYNAALLPGSVKLYYHISDKESQQIFVVNRQTTHTSTSTSASTPQTTFWDNIMSRDTCCVLTGCEAEGCDAAYLLPQSKGDEYIQTYTERRSRDPGGNDIIRYIDSSRNGLLLNCVAHRTLGKDLGFLMTPNFALNTDDIDPSAPPNERRCTSHVFKRFGATMSDALRPGSQLRVLNTPDFPPAIVFDAVYAGAVVTHFATKSFKDTITSSLDKLYYCVEGKAASPVGPLDGYAAAVEKFDAPKPDYFDALLIIPYCMASPDEVQNMMRKAQEKAEEEEHRRAREKVGAWLDQVASNS